MVNAIKTISCHENYVCEQNSVFRLVAEMQQSTEERLIPILVRLDCKSSKGIINQIMDSKYPANATLIITNVEEMFKFLPDKLRLKSERVAINMILTMQMFSFKNIVVCYNELAALPKGITAKFSIFN